MLEFGTTRLVNNGEIECGDWEREIEGENYD